MDGTNHTATHRIQDMMDGTHLNRELGNGTHLQIYGIHLIQELGNGTHLHHHLHPAKLRHYKTIVMWDGPHKLLTRIADSIQYLAVQVTLVGRPSLLCQAPLAHIAALCIRIQIEPTVQQDTLNLNASKEERNLQCNLLLQQERHLLKYATTLVEQDTVSMQT